MGIYREGMLVRILKGELTGEIARVVKINPIGLQIDRWGETLIFQPDEIEPAIMVELAPATPAPAVRDADKPIWHMEIQELRLEVEQSRLHTEDLQAELASARARIDALEAALNAMYDEDLAIEYGNLCQRYPYEPRINLFERVYGAQQQQDADGRNRIENEGSV